MCLAIPGKIKSMSECWAVVDIMGIEDTVNIQLIEKPKKGDYVLIHAGCAIQKINAEHFSYLQKFLSECIDEDYKHEC